MVSAQGLQGGEDLRGYKLVIAPALLIQTPAQVSALESYVKRGGHLMLTARCGMKDAYNALLPQRQPGLTAHQVASRVGWLLLKDQIQQDKSLGRAVQLQQRLAKPNLGHSITGMYLEPGFDL